MSETFLYDKARNFATLAHAGQYRKYTGEPYINHPLRVAAMAAYAYSRLLALTYAYIRSPSSFSTIISVSSAGN